MDSHQIHSSQPSQTSCIAFAGTRRLASGNIADIAPQIKRVIDAGELEPIIIFDATSSVRVEIDFHGTEKEFLKRLEETGQPPRLSPVPIETPRGPGRPKLGVVAREVTLLPRHWEWLNAQSGGASVALRKLVEQARKTNGNQDRVVRAQEACYRFMSIMAGNEPGFEEASRALYSRNQLSFNGQIDGWPTDIRDHVLKLSLSVFDENTQPGE